MQRIQISPVEIIGNCPAELKVGDVLQIEGMRIINPEKNKLCFLMLSQIPNVIWQLQSDQRFFSHVSCPGCTLSLQMENRVVLLLGHADKWELCQLISEYRRLIKLRGENQRATKLIERAIQLQNESQFTKATKVMRQAIDAVHES